jgi:hypothetical protein
MADDFSEVLVFYGEDANILARTNVVVSASQTPDAIFPLSRVVDERPSQRFIFPALQEDDFVLFDINDLAGGDFNSWTGGEPDDWTVTLTGTGTVVEETTSPLVDGSSLEMSNGANGNVEVENTIEVLSGETLGFFLYTQTSNADSPNEVEIFCPEIGKYLTAGGWSRRKQNFKTYNATSFTSQSETFVVEDYETTRRHKVTLRIRLHMDNSTASRLQHYDNVFLIPAAKVASVHSHNVDEANIVRLSSSQETLSSVPVESAVGFDGSTNGMEKSDNFVGLGEVKTITGSFWFKKNGKDGQHSEIFLIGTAATLRFEIAFLSTNKVRIFGRNNSGSTILNIETSTSVTADGTWHHILFSIDLANTTSDIYLDGSSDQTATTRANDFLDTDYGETYVGQNEVGSSRASFEVADFWIYFGQYFDLSVSANRLKWRTAGGRSAYLGARGELPVGSNPHLFLSNNAASFNLNVSKNVTGQSAGDFQTVNGTLSDDVTLEAEMAISDPTFFSQFVETASTARFRRFWRFLFKGINADESIEIGQLALGDPIELLRNPIEREVEEVEILPLEKLQTRVSRETWTNVHSKQKQRGLRLRFSHRNAHQVRLADLIWNRTEFGAKAAIVIPDTRKEVVVHGSAERNEIRTQRRNVDIVETELIFVEDPHGITLV